MTGDVATYQHELTVSPGMMPTVVTFPDAYLCHYITDDQLDMLGMLENEPVREICLTCGGLWFGALTPALVGFAHFAENKMTLLDLISIVLMVLAFSVTVVTGIAWKLRAKAKPKLVEAIRNRPKVSVRIANDYTA